MSALLLALFAAVVGTSLPKRRPSRVAPEPEETEGVVMRPWMQTYTGRAVEYPPRPEDVCLDDVAHSLANQCRYNGHTTRFYSVAEHSVLLSLWLGQEHGEPFARAGLLHDAGEAYVCDVPKPLKGLLSGYAGLSDAADAAIAERFGVPLPVLHHDVVKDADWRILADESAVLMAPPPRPWTHHPAGPLGVHIRSWGPMQAEAAFLARFTTLFGRAA